MLTIIENSGEIQRAQGMLESILKKNMTGPHRIMVGHPGRSFPFDVWWSVRHRFWVAFREESTRYWNAFGIEFQPDTSYSHAITVETCIPYEGIARRIQGAFAKDEGDEVHLVFRGRLGGKYVFISKERFFDHFRDLGGRTKNVRDGRHFIRRVRPPLLEHTEVACIGKLSDADFPARVGEFVHRVDKIKERFKEEL